MNLDLQILYKIINNRVNISEQVMSAKAEYRNYEKNILEYTN